MKRTPLKRRAMPRRTSTLSRTHKRESAAETEARHAFNAAVWEKGRCVYDDYECVNTIDPHHVVTKERLKDHFIHLPAYELLAIVFDPRDGVPCCRLHHNRITYPGIHYEQITHEQLKRFPEVYAFAAELGIEHLLERELDSETDS